jgi:predicted MFS family arabinose efflux permease
VRETLSILREDEPFRWFAFSLFTYGFGNLMVQPLYALYQVDVLHISSTQIANLANFASLWSIIGSFWWGRFMDRPRRPAHGAFSIICVTIVPLVYLSVSSWYGLLFAAMLMGFALAGGGTVVYGEHPDLREPGAHGAVPVAQLAPARRRGVLAPLVGLPLMKAFGYHKVFWIALVIMILGCFMQHLATRSTRSNNA